MFKFKDPYCNYYDLSHHGVFLSVRSKIWRRQRGSCTDVCSFEEAKESTARGLHPNPQLAEDVGPGL